MPNPRAGMTSYTFGGNIYCFGGVAMAADPAIQLLVNIILHQIAGKNFRICRMQLSVFQAVVNGKIILNWRF